MPFHDRVQADDPFHNISHSLVRQDYHHGDVSSVGQLEDSGVVVIIMVVVKASSRPHHVDLNFGVFVHIEVVLCRQVLVKRF